MGWREGDGMWRGVSRVRGGLPLEGELRLEQRLPGEKRLRENQE